MKSLVKILSINIVLLLFIIISPVFILNAYKVLMFRFKGTSSEDIDNRAYYPTYKDHSLAREFFAETNKLVNDYRSYIGWRSRVAKYNHINILKPYHTRLSSGQFINGSVWFFGGSTMWGDGVSDYDTIPSLYNKETGENVYNFAERGWSSRQSLNRLINVIADGHTPKTVLFYDGINDILHQCRTEIKFQPAHSYEVLIRSHLETSIVSRLTSALSEKIISPYKIFFKKPNHLTYDCHINKYKAQNIAKHLINNWFIAYLIAKDQEANFIAILQPNLFSSGQSYEYFDEATKSNLPIISKQLEYVYPVIKKEITNICKQDKGFCDLIYDATNVLEGRENIFIDHSHINKAGNKTIANYIRNILN